MIKFLDKFKIMIKIGENMSLREQMAGIKALLRLTMKYFQMEWLEKVFP